MNHPIELVVGGTTTVGTAEEHTARLLAMSPRPHSFTLIHRSAGIVHCDSGSDATIHAGVAEICRFIEHSLRIASVPKRARFLNRICTALAVYPYA